ncbi:hypothetical protein Nepgr_018031 [Nepenthes gracilis]|uniref:CRM domain-containing protein n=1 Tax=Nepenthes gracilis TaxID=150966 RepID=A0AAD3SQJ3_NEPGR|nr:hypothetical protein Nepgr_018031 [Nepenthes gracilis]
MYLTEKMAFRTAKLSEMPLRNSLPVTSHSPSFSVLLKPSISLLRPVSSLRTTKNPHPNSAENPTKTPSAPWLNKWPPPDAPSVEPNFKTANSAGDDRPDKAESGYVMNRGHSAIERIVFRLRNLGLGSDEEEDSEIDENLATGEEKLGHLLKRDWVRPDMMLVEEERKRDLGILPWEKKEVEESDKEREGRGKKKKTVKGPTLAELIMEDSELRRLRREGMMLRERINVPKAGITQAVMEKIHETWRKSVLVRLKFHEALAHDMKTAHEIVERRTGGLVIWRSGSVMVVYRGSNYEGPASRSHHVDRVGDLPFVPDVSSIDSFSTSKGDSVCSNVQNCSATIMHQKCHNNMTDEEVEFVNLLDGLGPPFVDWWGTGVPPVDGDLLPQTIPGFKPPLRLLPTGMRARLTNAELTNLRKLAKSLPCHFALGRNRHHQGLAAAIITLWEKSLVAKIAVKQGIQNTNNELMAEELKRLTGGILLLRNKYFIIIYRGKDFLPTSVAAALSERQEITKHIQDAEEEVRSGAIEAAPLGEDGPALAGTLSEFYDAQAMWCREISTKEREKMLEAASLAKRAREVKRIEHKLAIAQAKKLQAERLLAKIEASMAPTGPSDDQETITDEERFMLRRVGLRMKAYLPLGIRGIFDGVIENMHLHWKHRELVKLITKQKTLNFVEETSRLLEYESGGILVAVERVPKGHALIYYRGKNYQRPIRMKPINLLSKAKALKRAVAMQRHEALSQHIGELEKNIKQMKMEIGDFSDAEAENDWRTDANINPVSGTLQSEDECLGYDDEQEEDEGLVSEDEGVELPSFNNCNRSLN